jgi:hypothetical protein
MRAGYVVAVLLLLVAAGCRAKSVPPASEPQIIVTQADVPQPAAEPAAPPAEPAAPPAVAPAPSEVPPAPQPAVKPAARATPPAKPAAAPAPGAKTPAPPPAAKPAAGATPSAASRATPPVAKTTAAAPALDLKTLEERLRGTKAIGIFTKIALKNQVDDLLDRFGEYYQGKAQFTKIDLRRSYDLLMMKVLSLLQDEDQTLASDIVSSREAIWGLLADPATFATLRS